MTFVPYIHGAGCMNCTDFGETLTFYLVPPAGQSCSVI